ncbi:MAG TPA: hypothetical protein VLM85_20755 [Polyangiaceae bacterium]|nr:hypothetical protein [Polyangiaceae bacterium]
MKPKPFVVLAALALASAGGMAHDAMADGPSVEAINVADLIAGLDLDQAQKALASADPADPSFGYARARLALYQGDCDGAVVAFADPRVAKLDDSGLADIARGCARVVAATILERDTADDVVIRYQDEADRALGPLLVDTVKKARETLTRDLGVDWPKPTRIVVVRDLVALSAMTGLPYQSAATTGTVGIAKWGRVTLLSPRAHAHGYAWRDTLAHELTHLAVTHASGDRAPLWLQEGVAKREEVRWRSASPFDDRPTPDSVVALGIQKHLDLPFDKFGPSIAMLPSADAAMVAFAEVTSFIRYFAASAGDGALRDLLKQLRVGHSIDEALKTASGADLGGWEARWRAHLAAEKASPPPSLLVEETPELRNMRERVRLAELLLGRGHPDEALTQLDAVAGPLLEDPSVRYLKSRLLEAVSRPADAQRVLGDAGEVMPSYGPWWAIRGRLVRAAGDGATATADFVEAVGQDPLDTEPACETLDPKAPSPSILCDAARARDVPDVGRE